MAVLYRKYRPQTFSEVIGQKAIIQTLKNQVALGHVAHAYLFTGSRGIGKTSVARILAKALNCGSQKNGEPCAQCDFCARIAAGNFLDLIEVDAASNTGVDNIRDLIEHIKFSPSAGRYKVFIIDEVHMLSKGAFNALLKTLEEPPAHAIFILATTEINKVPATIISRTQRFDFKRLTAEDLERQIQKVLSGEKVSLPDEVIGLIAQSAEGSARDALSMLEKVLTLGGEVTLEDGQNLLGITDLAISQKLLGLILDGKVSELPDFFSGLLERGVDLVVLNRDFLEFLRKILVLRIVSGKAVVGLGREALEDAKNLAQRASPAELIFIIKLFLKSYKELNNSPTQEIPLLLASLEAAFKNSGVALDVKSKPRAIAEPSKEKVEPVAKLDKKISAEVTTDAPSGEKNLEAGEAGDPALSIGLDDIKGRWSEVIRKVKQLNSPLGNVLKNSSLESVSGKIVTMGVKFLFHKQSLENPKSQPLISSVLREVFGLPLMLRAEVVKEQKMAVDGSGRGLDDVLKVFGGELID